MSASRLGHDRYLCDRAAVVDGRVILEGDEAHHALRVRRLRVGDPLELIDGAGGAWRARVAELGRDRLVATIEGPAEAAPEPALGVILAPVVLKGDRFEWTIEKGTELGVRAFQPLLSERCEVRGRDFAHRVERWQRVAREAAKQCGRAVVPHVAPPLELAEMLRRPARLLLLEPDGAGMPDAAAGDVAVLCGPEGGFTAEEVEQAREVGAVGVGLGPRRLRAETAAVAAAALLLCKL